MNISIIHIREYPFAKLLWIFLFYTKEDSYGTVTAYDIGKGILVSVFSSMLAGSQTRAIILSSILLKEETDHKKLADTLEDTSILIPAMISWSTAFSVPAAALSATVLCIPFAFYLYLVPLYAWMREGRLLCCLSEKFG